MVHTITLPNELTATEAAVLLRSGELTSEELVASCLEEIDALEASVQAWEFLDPDLALKRARWCDSVEPKTPLHGIPVGIKDIIETIDMPTRYGSPIYDDHRPDRDAACVQALRSAGPSFWARP